MTKSNGALSCNSWRDRPNTKFSNANGIGEAIAAVLHAVPKDKADREYRPVLSHVHVDADNARVWASDGFRLAVVDIRDYPDGLPHLYVPFDVAKSELLV